MDANQLIRDWQQGCQIPLDPRVIDERYKPGVERKRPGNALILRNVLVQVRLHEVRLEFVQACRDDVRNGLERVEKRESYFLSAAQSSKDGREHGRYFHIQPLLLFRAMRQA